MPKRLEELTANELEILPRAETVFLYPLGVCEDHGPHLPLGLDLLEARALASEVASRIEKDRPGWVAVIMPSAALSADSETTRVALAVRPYVVRDWLVDSAGALWKRQGFKYFLCISGSLGPKQLSAIEDAGKLLKIRSRANPVTRFLGGTKPVLVSVSSAFFRGRDALRSPLWSDPPEHGGRIDTSIGLEVAPDLVRASYSHLPAVKREPSWWNRALLRRRRKTGGYWGEPAAASRESGAQLQSEKLEELMPKIHTVLDGHRPEQVFKSWYSIFPPNQSFFRAWMLALLLSLILVCWVYWTLKGITA